MLYVDVESEKRVRENRKKEEGGGELYGKKDDEENGRTDAREEFVDVEFETCKRKRAEKSYGKEIRRGWNKMQEKS